MKTEINFSEYIDRNEQAIPKWVCTPMLSKSARLSFRDWMRTLNNTKFFYLTNAIGRFSKNSTQPVKILDFGSGQGGLTIDLKRFFGSRINIVGYDVSPRAVRIAQGHKTAYGADVEFVLDQDCDVVAALGGKLFDIIVSTDVFGHVPDLPDCFHKLNRLLREDGELHAFSESITGERLFIANYLKKRGVDLDDSEEEHISLYSIGELKSMLEKARFPHVDVYAFDPIRFPFYPERYIPGLRKTRSPLLPIALLCKFFKLGLLRYPANLVFNQVNYFLAHIVKDRYDTAGCLISAYKKGGH